ncbi:MAG: RDD family protein [Bacilli bacterium]|jgi:uncharacterized RDD family membrane protein YckC|nr:RDD family protein [Bacilli bacterium]
MEEEGSIKVEYQRARFHRRVFAQLMDFLLFALVFIALFIGVRQIAYSTPGYQTTEQRLKKTKLDSGLFIEKDGIITLVTTYYSNNKDLAGSTLKNYYTSAIDTFLSYMSLTSPEASSDSKKVFDNYRLSTSLTYKDISYFVKDTNGDIKENPLCTASEKEYAEKAYAPFIDNQAQSLLIEFAPFYQRDTKYFSDLVFFIEVPIAFILGAILIYYIPPLFFKRGRKTLGKLAFHIARLGPDGYSLKLGRFTGEAALFIFAVFFLSLFTYGAPVLISLTLMAFSKKKQDFPDFMLNIQEVSDESNKIFFSPEEIIEEGFSDVKKPVDFKMEDQINK